MFAFANTAKGIDSLPQGAQTDTNLMPAEPPTPKSVFDIDHPYKDPFFPNSTRQRFKIASTNVTTEISAALFALKGLSGVPGQELAIINNRNLAAGERGEVSLPTGGTVWITVIKIDHYSVTLLPDGQRQTITLSLPKDDQ
jgi:hypothetical protein